MKRFHVHVSVKDLDQNVRFYSAMFGAAPTVQKSDYAKWMLEDPRLNFAISTRQTDAGLNHLGFQLDSDQELTDLREQVAQAEIAAVVEQGAACCYARSDKYWVQDPQGIAWETFHTLGTIPVFGAAEPAEAAPVGSACCAPKTQAAATQPKNACCG